MEGHWKALRMRSVTGMTVFTISLGLVDNLDIALLVTDGFIVHARFLSDAGFWKSQREVPQLQHAK